jgi:hypothetical protein
MANLEPNARRYCHILHSVDTDKVKALRPRGDPTLG